MDNVVQNINIKDIIPKEFQPTPEEQQKIGELANLIKQYGILEPILVRQNGEKYEIIMGIEKYEAALLANLTSVPVVIKDVTDDVYSKYKNVDNLKDVSLINQSKKTFSKQEENRDVINLDELSKIKLEYERDDVKMNNGQFNNDINNNFGVPTGQSPTFGGSFFPSLEDEPTNMNMMGVMGTQTPTAPTPGPLAGNDFNNNLIDLTDLSLDKELSNIQMTPLGNNQSPIIESVSTSGFETPNFGSAPSNPSAQPQDNIINIESLQSSNQVAGPINEPVTMDILNADFGPPTPPMMDNKFGMGMPQQSDIMPAQPQTTPMMGMPQVPNAMTPNYGMPPQGAPMMGMPPMSGLDTNMASPMPSNFGPMPQNMVSSQPGAQNIKDVTPVVNTIKNLVINLEAFGYKINVSEEVLATTTKIIIEVEK